jgi:hypothetical protein
MSDKFVTVMTFHQSFEAQLAKNLLQDEGINSMLSGELTADMLPLGQAGGSDQIVLQVHEDDAQRAAGLLAVVAAAKLDDNWEEEAEASVWLCSICGEPISNRLSVCYSCQTPREGIRTDMSRERTAIQVDSATLPTGEEVQKRDEIARTPAPTPASPPLTLAIPPEKNREEVLPAAAGDKLALRAFLTSWLGAFALLPSSLGLLTLFFLPLAWYCLLRAVLSYDKLSPRGARHLFGALLVNGFFVLIVLVLCARKLL